MRKFMIKEKERAEYMRMGLGISDEIEVATIAWLMNDDLQIIVVMQIENIKCMKCCEK